MSERSNGARGPSVRELLRESQRLSDDLSALATAAGHAASGWQALMGEQLSRQPYATLAVATGVGYVLGGGVPTGLVRVLFGLGGRWAIERALARFVSTPSPASP